MKHRSSDFRKTIQFVLHIAGILLYSLLFYHVWNSCYNEEIFHPLFRGQYMLALLYAAVLYVCINVFNGSKIGEMRSMEVNVSQVLALTMTAVIIYLPASLLNYTSFLPPVPLLLMLLVQAVFSVFWNRFCEKVYLHFVPATRLLVIGDTKSAAKIAAKLAASPRRYVLAGEAVSALSNEELLEMIGSDKAVLLCVKEGARRAELIHLCFEHNIQLFLIPTVSDLVINSGSSLTTIDTPLVATSGHLLTREQRVLKRFFDILFSLLAIILSSPLWLVATLAIKLDDGGPVFFRQDRLTEGGQTFRMYKFRSMRTDAEKDGQRWASANDDRITPAGRILRKFRLDELPQFLNVLAGDMSLVGPRPETPKLAEQITRDYPDFPSRLKVKAGITGYAQVYGNYSTHPEDKLLMDIIYIERYSLVLDISLLLMTVRAIFITDKTNGAQEGHAVVEEK